MRALVLGGCFVLGSTGLSFGCTPHPRAPVLVAIARAHAVDRPVFRIFPRRIGVRRCSIPMGGLQFQGRHIAGICVTRARVGVRALVSFTETWPRGCRRRGACRFHTWRITVGRGGRVLGERNLGDPAPQFYY